MTKQRYSTAQERKKKWLQCQNDKPSKICGLLRKGEKKKKGDLLNRSRWPSKLLNLIL